MKYQIITFKENEGRYAVIPNVRELRTEQKIYFYTEADGVVAYYELDKIESLITIETDVDGLVDMIAGAAAMEQTMRSN